MSQRKAIRGNLTPPKGSRLTGELLPDGRPIYRIKRAVKVGVEPMKDVAGRPVMKRPHPGMPAEQRMAPVMEARDVEFVIDDAKNGMTFMNFSFRASPEELAADQRRRAREAAIEELGDLAVELRDAKIRPADLIAAIRGEGNSGEPLSDEPGAKSDPMAKARAALAAKREAARAGG